MLQRAALLLASGLARWNMALVKTTFELGKFLLRAWLGMTGWSLGYEAPTYMRSNSKICLYTAACC